MSWIFCPHHAEATGATIALKRLLLNAPIKPQESIVVFPSRSPVEKEIQAAGYQIATLNIVQEAVSTASFGKKLSLFGNRLSSLWRYYVLFRQHPNASVFVNSSVQIAPMIAARLAGRRLVVMVHEAWADGRSLSLKRKVMASCAKQVIFVSHSGKKVFALPDWLRQHVQPNAEKIVSVDREAARRSLVRSLALPDTTRFVLFLGTPCRRKGVPDLVTVWRELAEKHPGYQLLIAGRVELTEPSPEVDAIIAGEIPQARFLGYRADSSDLIAAADLLALPSYAEAMPLVITEAMHLGTPVAARSVGDVAWMIGDGRGFLFEGDGPDPLKQALSAALAQPEEALRRAALAREFSHEFLDVEKETRRLWEFLLQP